MTWKLDIKEVARAVDARIFGAAGGFVSGVGTDTRRDLSGRLFVALKGDRFDAHDFIPQACEQGAGAVLVHRMDEAWMSRFPKVTFLQVEDTLKALQTLAAFWRDRNQFQILAISGSNGKTSSKEFCHQLLAADFKVHSSEGSFNNHWGVPLTLLAAPEEAQVLVLEMGMNHLGELTALSRIARPDMVGLTMVGQAHIGELGSQENVARAKEELYLENPQAGAIFNLDNEWTRAMFDKDVKSRPSRKRITFSSHGSADVQLRAERSTVEGLHLAGRIGGVEGHAVVPVFGRQNVTNLMFAVAAALLAEMSPERIWPRLPEIHQRAWGRNQWLPLASRGARVLFDAYNANPESMSALLKNVFELETTARKGLVLGEMLELGDQAEGLHRELGSLAGQIGADFIWFIGPHHQQVAEGLKEGGFTGKVWLSETFDAGVAAEVLGRIADKDIVAIKGSRGQKLERVLSAWNIDN